MLTVEDEIETYADANFSAEAEAQNFFTSNNDYEIERRKKGLLGLQSNIENLLKERVRQNYTLFLQVNCNTCLSVFVVYGPLRINILPTFLNILCAT